MTVAIKVENLSKKYIIRHEKQSGSYETFSDTLIQGSKNIANKIIHPFSGSKLDPETQEEFWALKDNNFEINQGDKVGIIGRNGAGKSTLLKILSRITEPTSGKVHINGRIASLLEVGTGFHPELTGRENIFLNGAILGMSRKEIKSKFDEIVAFAEVEKFLDTPVKRYSSGMYVRLAFSVAAHLEPEILVVDEVLAVGDIEFQKKCLGKMSDVSKDGRTILFVSHNLKAIQTLCNKGIVMDTGFSSYYNNIYQTLEEYHSNQLQHKVSIDNCGRRGGDGGIRLVEFSVLDRNFKTVSKVNSKNKYLFKISLKSSDIYLNKNIDVGIGIDNEIGDRLITIFSLWNKDLISVITEDLSITCQIGSLPLIPGNYHISLSISYRGVTLDYIENFYKLQVIGNSEITRDVSHGNIKIDSKFMSC